MLDQSYSLDLFFGCFVISYLYLFQEIVLLNPCYMSSKDLMLSFIDKVIIGNKGWYYWNVAPFVNVSSIAGLGGFAGTAALLNILDIMQFFDHDIWSSLS